MANFHYIDGSILPYHDGSQNVVKIEWDNGAVEYYQNGELHKDDGPALIHSDGSKEYWINGTRRIRDIGPSIEWSDGTIEYYEGE